MIFLENLIVRQVLQNIGRKRKVVWAIKAVNGGVFPRHDKKTAADTPAVKPLSFTPPTMSRSLSSTSARPSPQSSGLGITPGTVLIILAGRFMGKTVVFLKQLSFGLLLVTGPFKINGVPLRLVNQSDVIGTSTKIDISGVDVDKFDDKYFAKEVQKKKKGEGEFLDVETEDKNVIPQVRKENQKAVDTPLIECIDTIADMKEYLAARFSLKQGMKPHELVF